MVLLSFILASYGMTMIAVYGKIFNPIRPKTGFFGDMLACTLCSGFWIGMIIWNAFNLPFNIFIAGFISAGTSYMLSKIVDDDGIAIKNK